MSDEKFEEFLQREARAYNEPPATVPGDEMWAAISAARAARRAAPAAPVVAAVPSVMGHRRPVARYAPWIGMAATLLLGVGIGRYAMRSPGLAQPDVQDASQVAVQVPKLPATTPLTPPDAPASGAPTNDASPAPRQVASGGSRVAPATRGATVEDAPPAPTAYGVASQRHLASAEALISLVTATPRDAMVDSLTSKWARDMLSNTRLLLDSPAGEDAVRRRLLEDLETLLVQLVQRSGAAVEERDMIDRTLKRTQLLTRLRTNAAGT